MKRFILFFLVRNVLVLLHVHLRNLLSWLHQLSWPLGIVTKFTGAMRENERRYARMTNSSIKGVRRMWFSVAEKLPFVCACVVRSEKRGGVKERWKEG